MRQYRDTNVNELLLRTQYLSNEISTATKQSTMITLKVPLIPHGGSGEEKFIQLACPSERDICLEESLSGDELLTAEIRCLYEDGNRLIDDEEEEEIRSEFYSDPFEEDFFSHTREREERFEIRRIKWKLEQAGNTENGEEKYPSVKRLNDTTRNLRDRLRLKLTKLSEDSRDEDSQAENPQDENTQLKDLPSYSHKVTRQAPFREYQQNTLSFEHREPMLTILPSNSGTSIESIFSSSTAASTVSYSSSAILKLKARKRVLEKYGSRSNVFTQPYTVNEVSPSEGAHHAILMITVK